MGDPNNLRNNAEGYSDPTAYAAIRRMTGSEEQRLHDVIKAVKLALSIGGFELIERVCIMDKETGRVYR